MSPLPKYVGQSRTVAKEHVLATTMVNDSVTISIVANTNVDASAPVNFLTNSAGQQGMVSYFDLAYKFTTVGTSSGNPVPVNKLSLGGQTPGPPLPNIKP